MSVRKRIAVWAFVAGGLAGTAIASERPWVEFKGAEAGDLAGSGIKVVLVSGDEEYRSEEALPMLGKLLSQRHGFDCTVLFAIDPDTGEIQPDRGDHLPGLEALDDADLLILFTRFRRLPDEDMRHLVDYVESGRPLIGIRTATHAFAYEQDSGSAYKRWSWADSTWPGGFGRQVLGETWVSHHGHHGHESTRGVIPVAARRHPVLRGVEDVWGPTDVYGIRDLPPGTTVLLEGSVRAGMTPEAPAVEGPKNEPRMPIVWARELAHGSGATQRVLCSTIGAATDFESEDLRRLFVNASLWAVGREAAIPERADARLVGDYRPSNFGFGGFVQGVRPEHHALR